MPHCDALFNITLNSHTTGTAQIILYLFVFSALRCWSEVSCRRTQLLIKKKKKKRDPVGIEPGPTGYESDSLLLSHTEPCLFQCENNIIDTTLTLSQMTHFRLFQTERVCRRQFQT